MLKNTRARLGQWAGWIAAAICILLVPASGVAQTLNEKCQATLLNRSVQVGPGGTFSFPNIPALPGLYRVRVICESGGITYQGQSGFIELTPNGLTEVGPITFGVVDEIPVSITIFAGKTTFTTKGESSPFLAFANLPNGNTKDISTRRLGTLWTTTDARVATVDTNGIVTAMARGQAIIQALHEGVVSTVLINVLIPNDADSDSIPDEYEIANGLNLNNPTDASLDLDGDGLTNLQEYQRGTNPRLVDTDGDGVSDSVEVQLGTNPVRADSDGDGLSDGDEILRNLNPLLADTDSDGIPDGLELRLALNPLVANPTTVVQGRVVDTNGLAASGVTITVFDILTARTDGSGSFSVANVPASLGNIVANALIVRVGSVFNGTSTPVPATVGGVTDVGTIALTLDSGNVVGAITDPFGTPVPGALVTVTAGSDTRNATADVNGNYRVSAMPAGGIYVTARDPNTGLRAFATGTLQQNASAVVNVRLGPAGTVGGTVFGRDTVTPVGPGIAVNLNGQNTITDSLGKYRFEFVPLGLYTTIATDTTGNRGQSGGNISATAQVLLSDIAFLGRGVVRGVVRDGALNPVQNAAVQLYGNGVFGGTASGISDVQGRYVLSNVFIGPYSISAQDPVTRFAGNGTGQIDFEGQIVTNNITLAGSGSITGLVVRANGSTPVTNVVVVLNPSGRRFTTDGLGQYAFNLVPFGSYSVSVLDPETGDRAQASGISVATQDETKNQTLTMNGIGSVTVSVVNGANVAVSGANVRLTSQTIFGGTQTGVSQVGGLVTFANVLAGPFSVSATDPATGLAGSVTGGVADGSGSSVTVQLQSAGSIKGTVFAADGVTPVPNYTVIVRGQVTRQQKTLLNGTFQFDVLPTGGYSVEARDGANNLRARVTGISIADQGQEVTRVLTLIGTGTVGGIVRKPDSTPATGFPVTLKALSADYGGTFYTQSDINGAYQISNVPIGVFNVSASGQTGSTQYFGTAVGSVSANQQNVTADIALDANVIPVNGDPNNPSSVTTIAGWYDANNFVYSVTGFGSIQDGSVSVFQGDAGTNRGFGKLELSVGGVPQRFFAQSSTIGLGGREITLIQNGIAGLNAVRKIYVPTNGYFARYLEVLSNGTPNAVSVDLKVAGYYRFISKVQSGFTINREPRVIATSSGDVSLNVTNSLTRDRWVVVDDDEDLDPFLTSQLPAVAEVFDGTNGLHLADEANFTIDFSALYGRSIKQWTNVTIAPGTAVAFLHFASEQVTRAGAIAAAQRLALLPPEALTGLSTNELAAIQNFPVPAEGNSLVPALPTLLGTLNGKVLTGDNINGIPSAAVRFRSSNPIFGRTFSATGNGAGEFAFVGTLNNYGSSQAIPADDFTLQATHPLTGELSPVTPGTFSAGFTTATQNVVFANSGVLTGTIRRHNNVVVSSGTIHITGTPLLNPVDLNIAANGTYRIAGLTADTYALVATLPIPSGSPLTGKASATIVAGQTNLTDILIQPTGTLAGTLRRANNTVVVNLTVTLKGTNGLLRTTVTDTGGRYNFGDVPTGPVTLDAYDLTSNTAGHNAGAVQTDLLTTLDLTLAAGGTVAGTVLNTNGAPVVGANVALTTSLGTQNTTSGANGLYQFDQVPIGEVNVVAVDPVSTLRGRSSGNLGVSGQTLNLNVQLRVSGAVGGIVRRPDGTTPVAGAVVTAATSVPALNASTTTDANGQYAFDFLPAGGYSLTVTDSLKGETVTANSSITFNGESQTVNLTLRANIQISSATVTEGNVGTTNAVFVVTLSSPSAGSVGVNYSTASGTAFAQTDFQPKAGSLVFTTGVTTQTVSILVNGEVVTEPNETFALNLTSPVNANLGQSTGTGTIVNDDGFPGKIDRFVWANIPSPQYANQAFPVTITAKDAFGNTLSNFTGPVSIEGVVSAATGDRRILGNVTASGASSGAYTLGYSFTPSTNIVVTHLRHYGGAKVSIWTDSGTLLASQEVVSIPGTWVETALATPVSLTAGVRYRVAAYTGGGAYYWRYDLPNTFTDGSIDTSYEASGDTFPTSVDSVRWWFVDLKYSVGVPVAAPVTPAISGTFTDGAWTGNVTVATLTTNLVLRAADTDGHSGLSGGFEVQFRDDVAVAVTDSPDPVDSGAPLTYTVSVTNTGPSLATGVVVTNFLPANVTFGSVNSASGSTSVNGRTVTWTVGDVAVGANLTMTIQVTPTTSGLLTNVAGVTRTGVDGSPDNNLATAITSVLLPAVSVTDVNITEGNVGTKDAVFNVRLSYPSSQPVTISFVTSNGTATASQDYYGTNGVLVFSVGETSKPVVVRLIGDVTAEPNESFYVTLGTPTAATLAKPLGVGTILNDDGILGQLDHFDWADIASPQLVDVPFVVALTAKDAFGNTLSNYSGPASFTGLAAGVMTNTILNGPAPSSSGSGSYTLGYSFTPSTNLTVTHVRSYSGAKVSIWTDTGSLLVSQPVSGAQGTWQETPLTTPVVLQAGTGYRVAVFTGGSGYYYRFDLPSAFPHGTINQSYQGSGDAFPTSNDGVRWWFVDLKYTTGDGSPIPITPVVSGNFTDGTWTGNLTVQTGYFAMTLVGSDNDGHRGVSAPFTVLYQNDVSVLAFDTPDPVGVGADLFYSLVVSNTGPLTATNVVVTNFLAASVNYVNSTASQGTTSIAGRTVTATLGNLAAGATATVNITVTPTASGQIANVAGVTRDGTDAFAANNTSTVLTTVLLPTISIVDAAVIEGNTGTADAVFSVQLSYPSSQTVTVAYATTNGTALSGQDYMATNGTVTFAVGQTNRSIVVRAYGDTLVEPNETFQVRLSNPGNALLSVSNATGLILNDDGLPGQIDHFEWAAIPSPQFVGQAFPVQLTARDYFNETVEDYAGTVTLAGNPGGTITNRLLGDVAHSSSSTGGFTLGYAFTPNTNLLVTHVRSYSGVKVSIWMDSGTLLVAQSVASSPGSWVETPLTTPVTLIAGTRYRVAAYSGGGGYYWRTDLPSTFPYGTLDQSYQGSGDIFPTTTDSIHWWFVDLRYALGDGATVAVTPTTTGAFTNGVWAGDLTVQAPSTNLVLYARAASGHVGSANAIAVQLQNDVGVGVVAAPTPADVRSNLTYSITVSNTGPGTATAVVVSNRLPSQATLLSVTPSQGTVTTNGSALLISLGNLAGGATAMVTVEVKPFVDGINLTNQTTVTRGEAELYPANNFVATVTPVRGLFGGGGRVAIYAAESTTSWRADVRTKILGTGLFTQVDEFLATSTTPTLSELSQYDAVMIYSDGNFGDGNGMGNVLADYVDQGGGVVIATFAFNSGHLGGRLVSGGYLPFTGTSQTSASGLTLVKDLPDHPILTGVNSFNGGSSGYHNIVSISSGGELVAHWSNGRPLVGTKALSVGRVTGLNFFPPSSTARNDFWLASTDGAKLMANALAWSAAKGGNVPDDLALTMTDSPDPVAVGANVTYTLTVSNTGPSTATAVVVSNVPPANAPLVSFAASQGTVSNANGVVVFGVGELADGSSATLTVVVQATNAGSIVNSATVTRGGADGFLPNNTAANTTSVQVPALRIDDLSLFEGNAGDTNAQAVVWLSVASPNTVSVAFFTSDNSATTANGDYVTNNGVVVFPPNVRTQLVTVAVNGDVLNEADESFFINLISPTNATIADGSGLVTILNDDSLPTLAINDVSVVEGNTGTTNLLFQVSLSAPSGRSVSVNYATANSSALAGLDYVATNGSLTFFAGETSKTVLVTVLGDVTIEADETCFVNLSSAGNATFSDSQGVGTIVNNDGLPGQIDHFEFAAIPSPQTVGAPFPVTLTAKDGDGVTVSNFAGPVTLSAGEGNQVPDVILGNATHQDSSSGDYTMGFAFTPNTNLTVTHVRSYTGVKVSIWNDSGTLLASQSVVSTPGTWIETPLATPLVLQAGTRYRVASYIAGGNYYYLNSTPPVFAHGAINTSYYSSGDNFPQSTSSALWLVDLKYLVGSEMPAAITPEVTGNFANGQWIGFVSVLTPGTNVTLRARDGEGHAGSANPIAVSLTEDLAVTMVADATIGEVASNLTYSITVSNSGPGTATAVTLTNPLPASLYFVSANASQGSVSTVGQLVTVNLGNLAAGAQATVEIVTRPNAEGSITNRVGVTRAEAEGYLANNTAQVVVPVLTPFGGEVFKITDLLTTGVNVIDVNSQVGDDRGGLVVSGSKVLLTGDNGTGRFDVGDLLNGINTGTRFDTLVGDLKTAKIYSLGNGSTPINNNNFNTVTTLLELDDNTGLPTGVQITLSTPVVYNGNGDFGLFSGYGRILLHNGQTAYVISMPTGQVTPQGSFSMPSHEGTENSPYFYGIAEYFDGESYLVYVNGNNRIVRTRASDGVTSDIAVFSNLGDMASINASVSRNRWYYHYEGSAQFGSRSEALGYADATFLIGTEKPLTDDIALRVTAAPSPVSVGGELTYTLTVTNSGPSEATGVILSNAPGTDIVSFTTPQGTASVIGGVVVFNVGSIPAEASVTMTVVVTATQVGQTTNVATVVRNEQDPYLANNRVETRTTVLVPTLSIVDTDVEVLEGDTGFTNALVVLRLSAASSQDVSVDYALFENGASEDADYQPTNGTLTFLPGETEKAIVVRVYGDLLNEDDESIDVELSNPVGAGLLASDAIIHILNDDTLPLASIDDVTDTEGNTGQREFVFTVTLNTPSGRYVEVGYDTADDTATAGPDYAAASGYVSFAPGETTATIVVKVMSDVVAEADEQFRVELFSSSNVEMDQDIGTGTIENDDGFAGQVDHFVWSNVSSPKTANTPFSVTVTAKDAFGDTVTDFAGTVAIQALVTNVVERNIITNSSNLNSSSGNFNLGFRFTPNRNLTVTRFRHFAGTKVTIWTDNGSMVVTQPVSSSPGTWVETPLNTPVTLLSGVTYRIAYYTGGGEGGLYYYNFAAPTTFADGTYDGYAVGFGDVFPNSTSVSSELYLVDMIYEVNAPLSVPHTPTTSDNFVAGVWTGNVTIEIPTNSVYLLADDGDGHLGRTPEFDVVADGLQGRAQPLVTSLRVNVANPARLELQVTGNQGGQCVIETSTDLIHWAPLCTNGFATGSVVIDPGATAGAGRFYRARLQP